MYFALNSQIFNVYTSYALVIINFFDVRKCASIRVLLRMRIDFLNRSVTKTLYGRMRSHFFGVGQT